jgi:hypothetical protein
MATKRSRKPAIVHVEFENAADFRQMKLWAVQLPDVYGTYLGEGKGWQLPAKQDRFLEAMAALKGRITGPA